MATKKSMIGSTLYVELSGERIRTFSFSIFFHYRITQENKFIMISLEIAIYTLFHLFSSDCFIPVV